MLSEQNEAQFSHRILCLIDTLSSMPKMFALVENFALAHRDINTYDAVSFVVEVTHY